MLAMHSLRFHDIIHTLEDIGYRPQPVTNGVVLDIDNPDVIVDTLRLSQPAKFERKGHYNTLIYPNGQRIAVDGDFSGVFIRELN